MPALPHFLVTLSVVEVEPVESAVEQALGKAAPEVIEAVGNREHLFRKWPGCLQHVGQSFGEVVAVELKEVVPIPYFSSKPE